MFDTIGVLSNLYSDAKRGLDLAYSGVRPDVIRDVIDALSRKDWPRLASIAVAQLPRPYFDGEHGNVSFDAVGIPECAIAMAADTQLAAMHAELASSKAVSRIEAFTVVRVLHSYVTNKFVETFSKDVRRGALAHLRTLAITPQEIPPERQEFGAIEAGQKELDEQLSRWGSDGGK